MRQLSQLQLNNLVRTIGMTSKTFVSKAHGTITALVDSAKKGGTHISNRDELAIKAKFDKLNALHLDEEALLATTIEMHAIMDNKLFMECMHHDLDAKSRDRVIDTVYKGVKDDNQSLMIKRWINIGASKFAINADEVCADQILLSNDFDLFLDEVEALLSSELYVNTIKFFLNGAYHKKTLFLQKQTKHIEECITKYFKTFIHWVKDTPPVEDVKPIKEEDTRPEVYRFMFKPLDGGEFQCLKESEDILVATGALIDHCRDNKSKHEFVASEHYKIEVVKKGYFE